MELLTKHLKLRLIRLSKINVERAEKEQEEIDFKPLVKFFCPWGAATWLLTELDAEDQDRAFGLCDRGMGYPELGHVSLAELAAVRGPGGLTIERDLHFEADKTLQGYADEARRVGHKGCGLKCLELSIPNPSRAISLTTKPRSCRRCSCKTPVSPNKSWPCRFSAPPTRRSRRAGRLVSP